MKINQFKKVQVDAKTLKVHLKVCDMFSANLEAADGECLKEYEGYVPSFFPGTHYGDYVFLDIDIDTGQILNWLPPTQEQLETFIKGDSNED